MKIYIDQSYINKKRHVRIVTQACKFFAENVGLKSDAQLIVAVSPFAFEKRWGTVYGCTDKVAKGIYLITIAPRVANDIARLREESLSFLFHELEHVRQFHRGELGITRDKKHHTWKGKSLKGVRYARDPSEVMAWAVGAEYARDFLAVFPTKALRGTKPK